MRWDKELEGKLKEYPRKVASISNLKGRIAFLEEGLYTLKGSFRDTDPVQGGGSPQEDILLSKIMEKGELEKNLADVRHEIAWVDKGLACLTETELKIIQMMYLQEYRVSVEKVCRAVGYEKTQVYKIKGDALRKMTLELYGKLYS